MSTSPEQPHEQPHEHRRGHAPVPVALGLYGLVPLQPDAHFGRILAAYGGVFVASSLAWGMLVDGFWPDRWDVIGALICLAGVAVIMCAPRVSPGQAFSKDLRFGSVASGVQPG
ncbi:YnfA family protein [Nonomuraea sp. NPDC003804]|uniref:YnfA family protein n=1 Tax=Nonomuraea sp. NPDC003804 TaxID=3154547 RepID=UPI0033A43EC7